MGHSSRNGRLRGLMACCEPRLQSNAAQTGSEKTPASILQSSDVKTQNLSKPPFLRRFRILHGKKFIRVGNRTIDLRSQRRLLIPMVTFRLFLASGCQMEAKSPISDVGIF